MPEVGVENGTAIVTASYAGDFERCRLLCETMDERVVGHTRHLIVVSSRDVPLFRTLQGLRREIVDERDILPRWLVETADPVSLFRRRIYLSLRTPPLRGWHVQQFRKIAIARHLDEDTLCYVDSDVCFVRPFDCRSLHRDGRLRLFRRDDELAGRGEREQHVWSSNAGRLLGLSGPGSHDYITTLIGWRRRSVRAMMDRIEATTGRHWVAALGRQRQFSECMLYGRYVDEIERSEDHFHSDAELCRVYWDGPALDETGMRRFVDTMGPDQVAIALQSFTGSDPSVIRDVIG